MDNGLKTVCALLVLNAVALSVHSGFLLAFCWVAVLAIAVTAMVWFGLLWTIANEKSCFEIPKMPLAVVLVCTCIFGWTCMKINKDCDRKLVCELKAPWVKWSESHCEFSVSKKYMELVEDEEKKLEYAGNFTEASR